MAAIHLDLPSLRVLGEGVHLAVPRGAGSWMRRRGFERVTELDAGERLTVGRVGVTSPPVLPLKERLSVGRFSSSI